MKRLAVMMGLVCVLAGGTAAAAEGSGPRIAVVRIQEVFNKYDRVADMQASYQKEFEPDRNDIQKIRSELKDLADSLGTNRNIEKGDYAWFVKVQEIKTKEYLLKTMEKELNQRVNERMVTLYNTFYADFQSAVALYARQNGYDLVVRAADEELKSETAAGIQHEIGLKIVHYYSPALDKTNQILEVMNRIYEKAKAARKNAGS